MGAPSLLDISARFGGVGEGCIFRRGDPVADHELLGEILGGFKLRGTLGWAEDAQTRRLKYIDHTGRQRRFRADDGEMDFLVLRELQQFGNCRDVDIDETVFARGAGVTGCDVDALHVGICVRRHARACSRPPEPMTRSFIFSFF